MNRAGWSISITWYMTVLFCLKDSVSVCPNLWFGPNMLLLVRLLELQSKKNEENKDHLIEIIGWWQYSFILNVICFWMSFYQLTEIDFSKLELGVWKFHKHHFPTLSFPPKIHPSLFFPPIPFSYKFFLEQGLTVANISATTFPQTLDWLHGYLLQVKFSNQLCISEMC